MNPNYPIYIVSKGRWESRLTSKALERINVPYNIIVEQNEYDNYAACLDANKILVLPQSYLDEYETCDDLGFTKGKGAGAARNFAWEHSISQGAARHWVMDDNIASFNRLNRNLMCKVTSGTIFKVTEDFVDRYENCAIAGFNYDFFAKAKEPIPPFVMNTRIYSLLLIQNDLPFRWRGRYNEDTDLSIRAMKEGWCTVQFNAFLGDKATTQTMSGGNSDDFYFKEGTLNKSQMLVDMHPEITTLIEAYGRWHHKVDYSVFKRNKLIRKQGIEIPKGVNNFGMELIRVNKQ